MSESTQKKYTAPEPRYRLIEYDDTNSTVFVIQDSENDEAWIQAADTVNVGP